MWETQLYAAQNTDRENVTVPEEHIKAALIAIQLSNCLEEKKKKRHCGSILVIQLPKPAKRQIRETEITVGEMFVGKGVKTS